MIYGKLPVVLLSTLASKDPGSTNSVIARHILSHPDHVATLGIKDLANECNVGIGSISRFCKEIGLADFLELKTLLSQQNFVYETTVNRPDHIAKAITLASQTVNKKKILRLCKDIQRYDKVYAYGLLKAATAAVSLQADLLMLGKYIETSIPYASQLDHILHARQDELIIIFSYTGSYFDYHSFRGKEKNLMLPKIYMVTGSPTPMPAFVDETIRFQSPQDQASHPYQLILIASLIAEEYAAISDAV